jgi:hypothetical protein
MVEAPFVAVALIQEPAVTTLPRVPVVWASNPPSMYGKDPIVCCPQLELAQHSIKHRLKKSCVTAFRKSNLFFIKFIWLNYLNDTFVKLTQPLYYNLLKKCHL